METVPSNKRPMSSGEVFWFVVVTLLAIAIFVYVFKWAWNGSMTHVFGVNPVDFLQAFLLLLVARILFPSTSTLGAFL